MRRAWGSSARLHALAIGCERIPENEHGRRRRAGGRESLAVVLRDADYKIKTAGDGVDDGRCAGLCFGR